MSSPQMFTFSWSELTSSLASTAQQLHQHGDLIDVTLSAGGKIFHAHKLMLSAASPLLMEMLKSTKCSNPVLMLFGISADDLEAILHFIYHGEVTIDPVRLPCLLQAAQCLDIRALSPPPFFDKIVPSSVGASASHFQQIGKHPTISPYGKIKKQRKNKVKVIPNSDDNYNGIPYDQYTVEMDVEENLAEPQSGEIAGRRASIVSDLPVSCHICGAVIRQSRNLRRHMELVHMRTDYSQRAPRKKKSGEEPSPSLGSSSPSVGIPEIHEESPGNDMDCYAPSAQRVTDSYQETDKCSQQESRPVSQGSQSPPNSTHVANSNQIQQQSTSNDSSSDHAADPKSSSSAIETPPPPQVYQLSGSVNPTHLLPPSSHFPPSTPSGQHLNVYHDTRDGNS